MVKHQRRSHQRGIHSSELDGDTSDSDDGESPSTPQHSGQQWAQSFPANNGPSQMQHVHAMHRAHSFADFGQAQYGLAPYGHRHSVSGPQDYNTTPTIQSHGLVLRAPASQQHSYYIPEQNNPGVATMNTNPMPNYHITRPQPERHHSVHEIPYQGHQGPQMPVLSESIQSSPSSYSSVSGRSASQELYYTHQPAQAATYALQSTSPVDQQMPGARYLTTTLSQAPTQSIISAPKYEPVQESYPPQPQDQQHWYDAATYHSPVEIVSSTHSFAQALYDPWTAKIEDYQDQSMQMPSARIENL